MLKIINDNSIKKGYTVDNSPLKQHTLKIHETVFKNVKNITSMTTRTVFAFFNLTNLLNVTKYQLNNYPLKNKNKIIQQLNKHCCKISISKHCIACAYSSRNME